MTYNGETIIYNLECENNFCVFNILFSCFFPLFRFFFYSQIEVFYLKLKKAGSKLGRFWERKRNVMAKVKGNNHCTYLSMFMLLFLSISLKNNFAFKNKYFEFMFVSNVCKFQINVIIFLITF